MVLMLYSCNNREQLNEHVIIKQKIEPFIIENALSQTLEISIEEIFDSYCKYGR